MKTRKIFLFLVILGASTIWGCSSEVRIAEEGVGQFRALAKAKEYSRIYSEGSNDLHSAIGEQEFVDLLTTMATRLGDYQSSTKENTMVSRLIKGTFVQLRYSTKFSNAGGTERLTFRIQGDTAQLAGYHVNSPVLEDLAGYQR